MLNLLELSDEEIVELLAQLQSEAGRRQTVAALQKQVDGVIDEAREAGTSRTPEYGEDFEKPHDVTYAYKAGEVVEDDGKRYVSQITPNLCHPRECRTGWKLEDPDNDKGDG